MSEAPMERTHSTERRLALTMGGLALLSIVSIAFFNLDGLESVPPVPERLVAELTGMDGVVVLADSPVALAALEEVQESDEIGRSVIPLASWPPHAPLVGHDVDHRAMEAQGMELRVDEEPWSLWWPRNYAPLPFLGRATVEVVDDEGVARECPRDADGGFRCGDAGWMRMRNRTVTIDRVRETCIWAHPIQGRTVRFRFPDAIARDGQERALFLETALRDAAVGGGGAVDFRVRFGEEDRTHRHRDRRGGQSMEVPFAEGPEELIVEVSAERAGRRHTCFRFEFR